VYIVISEFCCSEVTVPVCKKNFLKFWWNRALDALKEISMSYLLLYRVYNC